MLDNSLRHIVRSDDQVQFLSAAHTLDADRRERRRGARPIAVEPRAFDWLVHLVQNRDRIVRKDDRLASVRGGRVVATLASRINAAHPMP